MFLDGGISLGNDDAFGDHETPLKRRKIDSSRNNGARSTENGCTPPPPPEHLTPFDVDDRDGARRNRSSRSPDHTATFKSQSRTRRRIGGFIDESDSENEGPNTTVLQSPEESKDAFFDIATGVLQPPLPQRPDVEARSTSEAVCEKAEATELTPIPLRSDSDPQPSDVHEPPKLKQESTSVFDPGDFDDLEDYEEDEFYEQGEEYLERRWMQEQQELELGLDADDVQDDESTNLARKPESKELPVREINAPSCPLCGGSLVGASDTEVSQHVNGCLDGKPTPLPKPVSKPSEQEIAPIKQEMAPIRREASPVPGPRRFQRAAIARPPQESPFSFASESKGSSAFSKLMSGHAEDAAWAVAAANEAKSRGRPAYERTCPFYKILPGFFICVDGFRYGKVEGCNAYFLSHFHSDHYIGLTSSWCHGPIYCSRVTANLVRQQLKVDPKWVRDLEWEQTVEVPDTKGVFVTMIPANHCPGSSLYLFEKAVGKGPKPRKQRVLHCGDFRACPAHVNHPLLRPDVMDAVSGKTQQQTIDVCYLDTTYLTPKYAFPSQEDVIKSCAQMCVSLSKEIVDAGDAWEIMKRERAGSGMVKFLGKEPKVEEEGEFIKPEIFDDVQDIKPQLRGRLLVVIGTYSIGKERICLGIARALQSKIYAPPSKKRICAALEDPELSSLLTSNPLEAQIHMQMLMEIRAETLAEYLQSYKPHFNRVVGFRPTGWNYHPPTSRFTENPAVSTVLTSDGWKSRFAMRDLVPQRGSTKESNCFGVPYSEHSSFRELTMFCCALRIGKVIPTVNVGSKKSRERMKMWVEKWEAEKKKNGLFKIEEGAAAW